MNRNIFSPIEAKQNPQNLIQQVTSTRDRKASIIITDSSSICWFLTQQIIVTNRKLTSNKQLSLPELTLASSFASIVLPPSPPPRFSHTLSSSRKFSLKPCCPMDKASDIPRELFWNKKYNQLNITLKITTKRQNINNFSLCFYYWNVHPRAQFQTSAPESTSESSQSSWLGREGMLKSRSKKTPPKASNWLLSVWTFSQHKMSL